MATIDTRQEILEAGKTMVQAHGYSALSFREIAKAVGVKSASVHYHFPTKGDLGATLARRYTDDGMAYLSSLRGEVRDIPTLLRHYADIFRAALTNDNRMCLCGIMAAEVADLPVEVRAEVDNFRQANVDWLADLLSAGEKEDDRRMATRRATAIYAALQGAQLVARGAGDVAVFDDVLETYRMAGLLP